MGPPHLTHDNPGTTPPPLRKTCLPSEKTWHPSHGARPRGSTESALPWHIDKPHIGGRCQDIRQPIDKSTSEYDKERPKERLAKLSGGVAVIRVGAPSEAGNSGFDAGVVVDSTRSLPTTNGFDAAKGECVNLVESGIIDPTKVVRVALENAVSVASVLLLTEATLTEIPEKTEPLHHSHGGFEE
jgi:chaperonin GroEL (HSP60 family)